MKRTISKTIFTLNEIFVICVSVLIDKIFHSLLAVLCIDIAIEILVIAILLLMQKHNEIKEDKDNEESNS